MSETTHHSHKKLYFIIFFALTLLTGLELMIPELKGVAYVYKATSLVGLAFGKAFIVAYFYMHLNEETTWMKIIAAVPLAAVAYATVVILETLYR